MGDSLTRFGHSETSYPISRRYVYFMIYFLSIPNLTYSHPSQVVQYSGVPTHPGVLSWADLLSRGKDQEEEILMARLRRIAINQCSTLVFTSGTTGNPKGVMLSHDNMTWNAINATTLYKMEHANTR